MQLKWQKNKKEVLILKKQKLSNNYMIYQMKIQYNIMINIIDKNKKNYKAMNILQLKWMLYNLIQKKNYKLI